MEKTRFTEAQIVAALKKQESGIPVKEICRALTVSDVTFYKLKSKYGGLVASDVRRLKDLEEENSHLKRMFAELSMDHSILKDVVSKKRLGPCKQRELTESIVKDYDISVSRACKLTSLPRKMYYYKSQKDDTAVIEALQDLAFKHPTYGFRKLCVYQKIG